MNHLLKRGLSFVSSLDSFLVHDVLLQYSTTGKKMLGERAGQVSAIVTFIPNALFVKL